MKKFLALAAVVALVACEKKADTPPAADSSSMMAPAPDTTTMMHDSMTDSMPRDTTHQM